MSLEGHHAALARALEPLGITVGPDVLEGWLRQLDRGENPLPPAVLDRLAATVGQVLDERLALAAEARTW